MTLSASQNLDRFTACHPTKLENGSRDLTSEPSRDSHQCKPSTNGTFHNDLAHNREHSITFGTLKEQQPCSTQCNIHEPFSIWCNGGIGQEIVNADGMTIAWTTDPWVAQVICKLLIENDGLLG